MKDHNIRSRELPLCSTSHCLPTSHSSQQSGTLNNHTICAGISRNNHQGIPMTRHRKLFNYIQLLLGLFILAFGVSLSVRANLGVTPISCVPYIYSLNTPFTLGEVTIFMNALFIIMQIVILRKKYKLIQLIQLPAVILLGYFIDLSMLLVSDIAPSTYPGQFFWFLLSCVFIALGVFLLVKANLTYIPGDGLIVVIAFVLRRHFGKIKIYFDSSMVIVGTASSLILMHKLVGIREGTFIAAILIGYLIQLYGKVLSRASVWFARTCNKTAAE